MSVANAQHKAQKKDKAQVDHYHDSTISNAAATHSHRKPMFHTAPLQASEATAGSPRVGTHQ
jgi:hypothetical protein